MTNNQPLVSIIIPVHNSELYLVDCLNSIKAQTFENFECFLVVNASKDSSIDICNQFSKQDSRFEVLSTEIPGVSHARNMALELVSGKYVSFVDSDDIVEPTFLECMLKYAETNKYDLVLCKKIWQKKYRPIKFKKQYDEIVDDNIECTNKMICTNPYNGTCADKLFKTELIGNLRFNQKINFAEDLLFCYEYLKNCKQVIYTNRPLYHYLFHKDSLSNGKFNKKQLTCLDVMDIIHDNSNIESIKNNAKAWKGFLAIMLIYYCKRDRYKDKETRKYLKNCIKDAIPYAKKSKHLRKSYKFGIKPLNFLIKIFF